MNEPTNDNWFNVPRTMQSDSDIMRSDLDSDSVSSEISIVFDEVRKQFRNTAFNSMRLIAQLNAFEHGQWRTIQWISSRSRCGVRESTPIILLNTQLPLNEQRVTGEMVCFQVWISIIICYHCSCKHTVIRDERANVWKIILFRCLAHIRRWTTKRNNHFSDVDSATPRTFASSMTLAMLLPSERSGWHWHTASV